jgi:hypothetical protein
VENNQKLTTQAGPKSNTFYTFEELTTQTSMLYYFIWFLKLGGTIYHFPNFKYANWAIATCLEDGDLTNYENKKQNSHKLQWRRPKFAQITGTKTKTSTNYRDKI